jgi:hypothetical protein
MMDCGGGDEDVAIQDEPTEAAQISANAGECFHAGAGTIGANTFPDPPGNEQDVRDNRP